MSAEPTILIRFDAEAHVFQPGETLSGHYVLQSVEPDWLKAVEVSVLWHTEGKGDEDMAVHEFWRRDADDVPVIEPGRTQPFETVLPESPLSYEGRIVHIRWCVRVRAFPRRGKELMSEKAFRLGNVPSVKAKSP